MLAILIAVFVFSLFDYFGYNWLAVIKGKEPLYRTIQVVIQILIGLATWYLSSFIDAVLYIWIWWTWGCDWWFYVIDEMLFRLFGWSYDKGALTAMKLDDNCSWAWWTIYGLLKGSSKTIQFSVLFCQSIIGLVIAIIIKTLL